MAVGFNLFPNDAFVARESLLPIRIAEDQDGIGPGSLSFRGENQAAERRLDAEHRKIVTGNASGDAMIAPIICGEAGQRDAVCNDVAEGTGLVTKIQIIGARKALQ